MTSRRIVNAEKTVLDKDEVARSVALTGGRSDTSPAVPAAVIYKLLGFTFAMVTAPLSTYFIALRIIGSTTMSGAAAAVMANIVLITYVVVAFNEDKSDRLEAERAARKKL